MTVLFLSHCLDVQLCKYPIAAPIISDLEHEIALQMLRVTFGVSITSLFFLRKCIELQQHQQHGKRFHGKSLKTMVK